MSRYLQNRHENLILLLGLAGPVPAVLGAYAFGRVEAPLDFLGWAAIGCATGLWVWSVFRIRARAARPLENITALLTALRQGDFSVRGHNSGGSDSLSAVLTELNGLADTLSSERSRALEAGTLLAKIMAEVEICVFAFDRSARLKLANRAGERLLSSSRPAALGAPAAELGLAELLEGPSPRTVNMRFAQGAGHWELRRSTFRLQGLPHQLVVLSDLQRALREEERQTWQRLVRVIGHELNNSLAPIRSLASHLRGALKTPSGQRPDDFDSDLERGLAVIERRAVGLERFMTSYARLAQLPPPHLAPVSIDTWVRRVVDLERRLPIRLSPGPALTIQGDIDQLDQLLINLVQNAVDAAQETQGNVEVSWRKQGSHHVELTITDEGPGVTDTDNLFVPFFTTKAYGSGIGLVLSRQICEAHRGRLSLESRQDQRGAVATLLLPR